MVDTAALQVPVASVASRHRRRARENRIRPSRFVHVVYRTCRFDEMVHWYQTVFDVRVQHRDPALAFLTYDERKQTTRVETLVLRD